MKIMNPATGTVLAELEETSSARLRELVARARKAQPTWYGEGLERRVAIIEKFRALLSENAAECAAILSQETGKPIKQARNEVAGTDGRLAFFLSEVRSTLAEQIVWRDEASGMTEVIRYEPLGVIANISAWNYPYFVGTNVIVPALLAGNAVIYKPSEFATLTGRKIAELLYQAGVPETVFAVAIGGGAVGQTLLDERLDGVFFTGSYATGAKVNQAAARSLAKVGLELGGKDPAYCTDDVDPQQAAEALADGAFYNAGQSCCAVERIYVHERVYDEFVRHFLTTVKSFKVGAPDDEETYLGPLTRRAGLDTLRAQVEDAVSKGAKLELGGKVRQGGGQYFEPTVLTGVDHTMAVMREESFGPIIGIQKVKNDDEAVTLMNETEYGLTAAVYCRDQKRAEALLGKVDAGTAYWNCCDRVSPRLPWSGRGHSGLGSTLGRIGIQTFVDPKAYHLRKS